MIRYIDLKGQDTGYAFAFWDTVTDRFIQIGNDQAWDGVDDLGESFMCSNFDSALEKRLTNLIPK